MVRKEEPSSDVPGTLPCPALPPGYHTYLAWGFRDRGLTCEFMRVYGPPVREDKRGPICRLERDLCHWVLTWPLGDPDGRTAGLWITYAQAREQLGSQVNFEQFSSLTHMRDELSGLLRSGEVRLVPEPAPAPSPSAA